MEAELLFKPATELAGLIRDGELASRELVETAFERIEALEPELNAFCHLDREGALAAAELVNPGDPRPFAGVPIAIKDTAEVAGWPYTLASEIFGDFVPEYDAFVVRRLIDAGFVPVGKTSLPEFGILPVTEPRRFGATRNPWDTDRTPGGSSGGSAAARAAGMVPPAHRSDRRGSIRIAAARRDPGGLRVGVTVAGPIEADLDPQCRRAVDDATELLASLGHEVEEVEAPWTGQDLLRVFAVVFGTPVAMGMFFGAQVTGREPSEELVEPLSWTMWNGVQRRTALDYLLARTQLAAFGRAIVRLWDDHDVVMTPALAERPVRIGEIDACSDDPWDDFRRSGRFTPYTALFNVTGQPAISVPLFHGDDGLPLGVQLAGRPADEATLLSLAAQLEAARPWADRRPELAAA